VSSVVVDVDQFSFCVYDMIQYLVIVDVSSHLHVAGLRAKCAIDLEELLGFKVKQYAQGTAITVIIMSHSNHTHNRYASNGDQIR